MAAGRDPAVVEAMARAIAAAVWLSGHGQRCPVWTQRSAIDECDCWVLRNARKDAEAAYDAMREHAAEINSVMQDDLAALLRALGMSDHARPQSPHEVMLEAIAAVERLRTLGTTAVKWPALKYADGDQMHLFMGVLYRVVKAALDKVNAEEADR